jgi:hypothetical protein
MKVLITHFNLRHCPASSYVSKITFLHGDTLLLPIQNPHQIWEWSSASLCELFEMTEIYPPHTEFQKTKTHTHILNKMLKLYTRIKPMSAIFSILIFHTRCLLVVTRQRHIL